MRFPHVEQESEMLRLEDNQSVIGILRGEPYEYRTHWGEGKSYVCSGDGCTFCQEGKKSNFRFRMEIFLPKMGIKILDQGYQFYKSLREINEKAPLETRVIKITRKGALRDTKYFVELMPDEVNPALIDKINQLPKLKMDQGLTSREIPPYASPDFSHEFETIPFYNKGYLWQLRP